MTTDSSPPYEPGVLRRTFCSSPMHVTFGRRDCTAVYANHSHVDRGLRDFHDSHRLELVLLVWGYALAWFAVNDRLKLTAYRFFDLHPSEWLSKSKVPT